MGSGAWVINEPRAALLATSYLQHMPQPLCVIVYREPLSFVRASMRRRFSSWTAFEVLLLSLSFFVVVVVVVFIVVKL